MKEAKFFRKQNVIRGPEGDNVFHSVNKAKKESRALQIAADGAMGRGSLRVVEKFPPEKLHPLMDEADAAETVVAA